MVLLAGSSNQGPTKYRSTTQYEQFLNTNRGPARNMPDGDRTGVKRAKREGKLPRDTMSVVDQSEAELSLLRVITLAQNSDCEHGEKLETWTHENRERVTTCGRLQAEHVSGVNFEVCQRLLPVLLRRGTRSA